MIRDLWQQKIQDEAPADALEQENLLQELMQHHLLASLSRAGLFKSAVFHGGTCLRLLFNHRRFSEDLDFMTKQPDPGFLWKPFLDQAREDCEQEGIQLEVVDRSDANSAVRKAFLKTDSIGKVLLLDLPFTRHQAKKLKVKLEIDTNPPAGSTFETRYITFPTTAPVTAQTLESGFGTKSHALLCRGYTKGRDWYDLIWYASRGIVPNLLLLENALHQQGPWAGQGISVTPDWYLDSMRQRIEEIDWAEARRDVQRFLPAAEQQGLSTWSRELFIQQLERLAQVL
jgi:predicted nucleotidyltransferase component of viral defense system